MPLHSICGLLLHSGVRLGALPEVPDEAEGKRVVVSFASTPPPPVAAWLAVWDGIDDSRPYLSVAHLPRGFLFRYHRLADFSVELGEPPLVVCHPRRSTNPEAVEELLCTHVVPQLAHLLGDVCLHAAAVALPDGTALAFLGESGSGKSTLAASFGPPYQHLADDALVVRLAGTNAVTFPGWPWSRLCEDSLAALAAGEGATVVHRDAGAVRLKARVSQATRSEPARLRAIYILGASSRRPRVVELPRSNAVVALARSSYRTDIHDAARLEREFQQLADLVERVRVAELRYPRRFDLVPRVRDCLERDFARAGATDHSPLGESFAKPPCDE